jgi:hypothetical protein
MSNQQNPWPFFPDAQREETLLYSEGVTYQSPGLLRYEVTLGKRLPTQGFTPKELDQARCIQLDRTPSE